MKLVKLDLTIQLIIKSVQQIVAKVCILTQEIVLTVTQNVSHVLMLVQINVSLVNKIME